MADSKKKTVTREDARGNKIEVEVGIDGKNPVSPNNPVSEKALLQEPTWDYTPGDGEEDAPAPADLPDSDKASNTVASDDSDDSKKKSTTAKKTSSSRKK